MHNEYRESPYAFHGRCIKLSVQDLVEIRSNYPAIPDLNAALVATDRQIAENLSQNGNWWGSVHASLNYKNNQMKDRPKWQIRN